MLIHHNVSLGLFNSFNINVIATYFALFDNVDEVKDLCKYAKQNNLDIAVIGEGTNVLLTQHVDKLLIKSNMKNITIIKENEESVSVEVDAGVIFDDFVTWSINNNLSNIENLSSIPGTVGAAPIQNIGAYGVEIQSAIEEINYLDIATQQMITIKNKDCQWGYRDSIFKKSLKNKTIILSVVFNLSKQHSLHITYKDVQKELELYPHQQLSVALVAKVIRDIRNRKLPNYKNIPNAGSFFKNPIINKNIKAEIEQQYGFDNFYKIDETHYKIPAAWLIEQCGFKNQQGKVRCYITQPLVIINPNSASGKEVLAFSQQIQHDVKKKFNIDLETEVNIW